MAEWPKVMFPVRPDQRGDALVLDTSRSNVEVFQLTAGALDDLVTWMTSRGLPPWATYEVNGGPVVVLPGGGGAVGLGDFVAIGASQAIAYPGGGFYQQYQENPAVEGSTES